MGKIRRGFAWLRAALKKKIVWQTFIAVILIIGAAAALTWQNNQSQQRTQQTALENLVNQQKVRAKATAPTAPASSDVSSAQFSDQTNTPFSKPTCPQLQNRPGIIITSSDCSYRLRAFGYIRMDVVFVYDAGYDPTTYNQFTDSNPSNKGSLYFVNTYYKTQAARYSVSNPMQLQYTFYGPFKTTQPVDNIYYRDNMDTLLTTFQATAAANIVPEQNYDLTVYVLLDPIYGGGAFPSSHQAFAYSATEPMTFAHETLHLFGASDKYNNNDCATIGTSDPFGRYNGTQPGKDIMCDNFDFSSNINDITAREIGWAN